MRTNYSTATGMAKVPLGVALSWFPHLNPDLPPNWVECNGQTLNDPMSPLHGKLIPNMNDGQYLTGGPLNQSGVAVGSNGVTLSQAHLPSVAFTGTSSTTSAGTPSGSVTIASAGEHTHAVTDPGHFHDIDGVASGLIVGLTMTDASGSGPRKGKTASKATGIAVNSGGGHAHSASFAGSPLGHHSHTFSANLNGGTQAPLDNRPASVVCRWIMRVK